MSEFTLDFPFQHFVKPLQPLCAGFRNVFEWREQCRAAHSLLPATIENYDRPPRSIKSENRIKSQIRPLPQATEGASLPSTPLMPAIFHTSAIHVFLRLDSGKKIPLPGHGT